MRRSQELVRVFAAVYLISSVSAKLDERNRKMQRDRSKVVGNERAKGSFRVDNVVEEDTSNQERISEGYFAALAEDVTEQLYHHLPWLKIFNNEDIGQDAIDGMHDANGFTHGTTHDALDYAHDANGFVYGIPRRVNDHTHVSTHGATDFEKDATDSTIAARVEGSSPTVNSDKTTGMAGGFVHENKALSSSGTRLDTSGTNVEVTGKTATTANKLLESTPGSETEVVRVHSPPKEEVGAKTTGMAGGFVNEDKPLSSSGMRLDTSGTNIEGTGKSAITPKELPTEPTPGGATKLALNVPPMVKQDPATEIHKLLDTGKFKYKASLEKIKAEPNAKGTLSFEHLLKLTYVGSADTIGKLADNFQKHSQLFPPGLKDLTLTDIEANEDLGHALKAHVVLFDLNRNAEDPYGVKDLVDRGLIKLNDFEEILTKWRKEDRFYFKQYVAERLRAGLLLNAFDKKIPIDKNSYGGDAFEQPMFKVVLDAQKAIQTKILGGLFVRVSNILGKSTSFGLS
ncbi:hypothetical protein CCR75_009832 [Bremia lactucae]|uniref:RxLR effector protein n=1 Tax=Bremia lactucae TaxID=4779 RepID=A0A976FLH0_BRELC|nr:hypothetical protein CCR75_009832 [Bremia lactucae]